MAVNPVHSTAYAYEREYEYEVEQPIRQQPTRPYAVPQHRAAPGQMTLSRAAAARMIAAIVAICALAIALVYMKAQVTAVQRSINDLKTEIYSAERVYSDKLEQLSEAKAVPHIMQRAQELGMGYPEQDAVTYVRLNDNGSSAAALQGN